MRFDELRHVDFASVGLVEAATPGLAQAAHPPAAPGMRRGFERMCTLTQLFLDARLRGREAALAAAIPAPASGVASDGPVVWRPGLPRPPAAAELLELYATSGAQRLRQLEGS